MRMVEYVPTEIWSVNITGNDATFIQLDLSKHGGSRAAFLRTGFDNEYFSIGLRFRTDQSDDIVLSFLPRTPVRPHFPLEVLGTPSCLVVARSKGPSVVVHPPGRREQSHTIAVSPMIGAMLQYAFIWWGM